KYRALADACELSASPQIRNVGTMGGNLAQESACEYYRGDFHCWLKGGEKCFMREGENRHAAIFGYNECVHVHPSDPAIALVALDAKIFVRGKNGAREIAAAEFFQRPTADNRRLNVLGDDELITNIQLPLFPNSRSAYEKAMERATFTHALVSAAVRLDFDGEKISAARVVLGAVAPIPWREARAEEILVGKKLSDEIIAHAAEVIARDAQSLAQNAYKVRLARALVKRGLMQLM
ncbi:MAG: FAD binding domain-containing protein, partial [Chloroflexi bacterium]|nr:FAD binding domain-containing protein [Chloroflexota bacterium]